MSPEEAKRFLDELREHSRDAATLALSAAAQAFKLRRGYLHPLQQEPKQPQSQQTLAERRGPLYTPRQT